MRKVCLVAAAEHDRGNLWRKDSCDIALDLCESFLSYDIHGFFVAAPSSARLDGQANYANIFADRLGLPEGCLVQQFNNGDSAGATALSAAYAFIRAGLLDTALVLGVAKVSDWEDKKRYRLVDEHIDTNIEKQLGLDYLSLNGLLADCYLKKYRLSPTLFHHLVSKNHANACQGTASYLSYPALPEELARDLKTASPLGRSDIAPFLDGGTALLLAEAATARKITKEPVLLSTIGYGIDVVAIADRADMCSLAAVKHSIAKEIRLKDFFLMEIQNPSSILEVLAVEGLGLIKPGQAEKFYKDGGGQADKDPVINARGGQQGLGNLFGLAAIEHGFVAFQQLRQEAEEYQLTNRAGKILSLCLSGLGAQSYSFIYEKMVKSIN